MPPEDRITEMLNRWAAGEKTALDQLMPLVYGELHRIAERFMARQSPTHTLQPTAVINEAYLKLAGGGQRDWQSRAHFLGVAAKAMRQILVDHARADRAAKRGGEVRILRLQDDLQVYGGVPSELVALDEALSALTKFDPRKSQIVELRYFGGLSVEETARTLQISAETVARDWRFAKSFLRRQMDRSKPVNSSDRP
jgi:RNA polymerase sigma factor (TIGR02999 family)